MATEPNDNEIGRVNSWTLRIAAASCAPRSVAKLTATPNPVDPGANVVLDASASGSADPGGITRYEWDLADGTGFHEGATPTTATRTVSFAQRGRRTIQVRVSDATGVIGTASMVLIVSHLPNAIIGLPSGVKEQTYATLDGSGSNDPDGGAISSYEWETDGDDDFNDFTGSQPSVFFATPGSHTIKLRVTDGDGAQRTATTTLNVIATTPPSPTFVATPNPVMAGQPVTFDAGGSTDDGTICATSGTSTATAASRPTAAPRPRDRTFPNATVMSIGVRATDDEGAPPLRAERSSSTRPRAPAAGAVPRRSIPARPMVPAGAEAPGARRLGRHQGRAQAGSGGGSSVGTPAAPRSMRASKARRFRRSSS